MRYLIIIIFSFALSCKLVVPSQDAITWEQWNEYKAECYNDSTMQIFELNNGELIDSKIIFEKDTVWIHKMPVWDEFLKQ